MKTKIYSLFAIITFSVTAWSQGISISVAGEEADGSAILDIQSTTKGFLPPRMSEADRDAIANPATGLIVYNTDEDCIQVNNGTPATPTWVCLGAVANSTIQVSNATPTYNGENVIFDNIPGNHNVTLPNPASPQYANKILYYRNNSTTAGTPGTATFITYTPINNSTCIANRGMVLFSNGTNWFVFGGF